MYERTAYYDKFATRYGWELKQTDRQPQWFLSRAPQVWALYREIQQEQP